MKVLCVAEKPSIAKAITGILSGGHSSTRPTAHQYIRNYDFAYRLSGHQDSQFTVTAVLGHLTCSDFPDEYRKWSSCDPFDLFSLPVNKFVNPDHRGVEKNLVSEARRAARLMIWTDCDREGENIGAEIAGVCKKANPNIQVSRARFSAIIPAQIHQACRTAGPLDMRQAVAVDCRIELDLRIGAALTRAQSLGLQNRFHQLAEKVISYGPCQFPTLGFVVDQYDRVQSFVPETFYYISVALDRDDASVEFTWKRGRLFDQLAAVALYEPCMEREAEVVKVETKPATKWKPLPLTTVELQKSGSRLLKLSPKKILDIAESLYQKGFVSYPRTETDQFDPQFDHMELVKKQTTDAHWGQFASMLVNGGFQTPRNGKKNDKAHPPIHPTAHVSNLSGDDRQVYELITRRYLACCSKNAVGKTTTVEIEIVDETFSASGLIVTERNYLDVYRYDKWSGSYLPDFQLHETFLPSACQLKDGQTTAPSLLTEADLVGLMDRNGIGTDATIAEHIAKIIERQYVFKLDAARNGGTEYLVPSTLGTGLVEGYNAIGFDKSLSKPQLRRETEHRMMLICDGRAAKHDVLNQTLDEYRDVYIRAKQSFGTLVASVDKYLNQVQPAAGNGVNGDEDDDDLGEGGSGSGGDDSDGGQGGGRGGGGGRGRGGGRTRGRGAAASTARRGAESARGAGRGRGRGTSKTVTRRKKDDDDDDRGPDGAAPRCNCQDPAVERTVSKDGPNKGRRFWTCAKPREDGSCGFFEWLDDAAEPPKGAEGKGKAVSRARPLKESTSNGRHGVAKRPRWEEPNEEPLRCECELEAASRTVSKAGDNQGRVFYTCPKPSREAQCKFFKWQDELDDPPSRANGAGAGRTVGGTGGGGGTPGECFKCGQVGHWSNACPNGDSRPGGSRSTNGGQQSNYTCHACGEQGHFSTNCPNKNAGAGNSAGNMDRSCFECGGQGHWAAECPQRGGGSKSKRGRGGSARGGRARGRARGRRGGRAGGDDYD